MNTSILEPRPRVCAGVMPPPAPLSAQPWLAATLDEVDHAMVLVGPARTVLLANRAARRALADGAPLALRERRVHAPLPEDAAQLAEALQAAARGLRRLVQFGRGQSVIDVAVVPLRCDENGVRATLLMLGRGQAGTALSLQCYALRHRLTPCETQVVAALCAGEAPAAIARRLGIAVSTVRTHVGSARAKVGAPSIRQLCEQIARLPPLAHALAGVRHG